MWHHGTVDNAGSDGHYGYFKIEDSYATNGQDPDRKIAPDKIIYVNQDGKLCFRVGRKGSKESADWWKNRVPYDYNTFNKNPKDLNFALKGTLVLNIDSGVIGGKKVVTYPGVCMAQGNTAGRNNWWFGGTISCYYNHMYHDDCDGSRKDAVMCFGCYNDNGTDKMVRTLVDRSELGASVNTYTFYLKTTEELKNASWMSRLPDETAVKDIMMPASHDSGMSELHHTNFFAKFNKETVKTQKNSVFEQLMCGVRYFDLRVDFDHDELVTYHRTDAIGSNGQSCRTVFMQACDFLKEHKSETFIFKISHLRNYDEHNPDDILNKFLEYVKDFNDYIYQFGNAKNLHKITLKELRGKILMVYDVDKNGIPDSSKGTFRYKDAGNDRIDSISDNLLSVYDKYSNEYEYEKMKNDQLAKWEKNGNQSETKLFLLSWTLTLDTIKTIEGVFCSDYTNEALAEKANGHLAEVLSDCIVKKEYVKPNMVYLDYIDSKLCEEIIAYNFN